MGYLIKKLRKLRRVQASQWVAFAIIIATAGIGLYLLTVSRAQSPFSSNEAENGTLAGQAIKGIDASASNGGYVQFGTPSGWTANYWNNITLTGTPVLTRNESQIGFNYSTATSPAPGVNATQWSARYTSSVTFTAGTYTFSATADDGVRVYVDGNQIISGWLDQSPTTYTASDTLTAGVHQITVEYYNNCCGETLSTSWSTGGGTFDEKTLLSNFEPGLAHEALPHGVPTYYDWESHSTGPNLSGPDSNTTWTNWWGQVYVDTTDIHAANVVVELDNCQYWALPVGSNTWTDIMAANSGYGGAYFSEDFTTSTSGFSLGTGADPGAVTTVPPEGYNSHFWSNDNHVNEPSGLQAAVIVCRTRLALANPSGPDNRAGAHYLLSTGADWKLQSYGCPTNAQGTQVCGGLGVGKFIQITSQWRDAIYSSFSATQLNTIPLPPPQAFVLPDGTYPGPNG